MDLEKKGVQSYQGTMYARLVGFGNGTMKSLYDRSLGFFRRQIILTTKDRPPDRVDDPFLSEKLAEEREGIFLWAFEGLQRLIANEYRFTISDRSQDNLKQSIEEGNNVLLFLKSEGCSFSGIPSSEGESVCRSKRIIRASAPYRKFLHGADIFLISAPQNSGFFQTRAPGGRAILDC